MRRRFLLEAGLGKAGLDVFLSLLALASFLAVLFAPDKNISGKIYDAALGIFVSTIFYYLVVRIPDFQKKQRLKRNLRAQYEIFRQECIQLVVEVADGICNPLECAKLMIPSAFREYFKQDVGNGQSRWDAFENNISQIHLDLLFTNFDLFREEVVFLLNSVDISDERSFDLMKRLSSGLYVARKAKIGYDEIKPLASFLYEVLAGWSFVDGYKDRDIIFEMIEAI